MFILVWVSWSHSWCFYSFRSTTKYLLEELKKLFLSVKQSKGKCFNCNKDIRANDTSSLTDGGWKTFTKLAKTSSSLVLPIDHQYMSIHRSMLIGDRKTTFFKQYHSRNCFPVFARHSIINKLKKGNAPDKPAVEAAAASTSLPSDASLLSSKSSTTRTH